jgi:hypothetical protein
MTHDPRLGRRKDSLPRRTGAVGVSARDAAWPAIRRQARL